MTPEEIEQFFIDALDTKRVFDALSFLEKAGTPKALDALHALYISETETLETPRYFSVGGFIYVATLKALNGICARYNRFATIDIDGEDDE